MRSLREREVPTGRLPGDRRRGARRRPRLRLALNGGVMDKWATTGAVGLELKPDRCYTVDFEARADNRQVLSRTADRYRGFDFEIVD